MSDFHIQKRIYEQIDTKNPPVLACNSGSVFMYSTANGLNRLFYTNPEKNVQLPKSPFADSRASCIAISPPHTFGVVCYENGSILIYNLIEKKVLKSLSKELHGTITSVTFLSDLDFVTFDSNLTLTLFTMVSMSIFGYTVKSTKIQTFNFVAQQIISPPVHRAVIELPKNINTVSYRYSEKFDYFIAIPLHKKLIIAKVRPNFKVIFETNDDDEDILDPHVSFSVPNPDTLYFAYSTKKEIIVIGVNESSTGKYTCRTLFQKPYTSDIRFLSFFSTSLIAVVNGSNLINLFDFMNKINSDHISSIQQCNILLDDLGKIDTFTNRILISYYINTFASTIQSLHEDKKYTEIIELAKKAAKNDPNSSVGLSTDPLVRSSEIESLTNPIFAEYYKSRKGFLMNEFAEEIVSLMEELNNKGFIAQDALPMFVEWRGTKEFFTAVLSHDPDGQKFTYNPNFVKIIIDKFDQDEYFQKDEEKQQYFSKIKRFLLQLPPKIAKPKWLINFALKRKDMQMATQLCIERMNEPVMGLNLAESTDGSEMIPDIFTNNQFRGNVKMIEWLLQYDAQNKKYSRLQNAIKISEDKMLEALRWMNDTMADIREDTAKAALEDAGKSPANIKSIENIKSLNLMKDLYIYVKEYSPKQQQLTDENSNSTTNQDNLNTDSSFALNSVQKEDNVCLGRPIITNDYYVNAVISTFVNLNIGYQTPMFKVMEDYIIKNCPDNFTSKSLKYIIQSIFSKEFLDPDYREVLLSSLIFNEHVISNDMALSLIPLCESFEYNEAAIFLRNKLHLTGDILKSIIVDNGLDDALSFINANYRDDLQSMEEIENVVIYYTPYFIEHDCDKFIDVLTNVRFRILYTDLPKSISDVNTRLFFMRKLYTKFDPPETKYDNSSNDDNFATTFLKNLTNKWKMARKEKEKAEVDPLGEIYKAYSSDDMDTFYALSVEYFGNKSKVILPIILRNMTPEKLSQLENLNKGNKEKSGIQPIEELMNNGLMIKIQTMIEEGLKAREEKKNAAAGADDERAKKEEEKKNERKKMEDFFEAAKVELEKKAKSIIPFLAQYFPQDVITVMRKFPRGLTEEKTTKNNENENRPNSPSIIDTCKSAALYDCCAYYEALNGNIDECIKYLRMTIIVDPVKYEETIVDTCHLIFDAKKTNPETKEEKKQVGGWYDDDDKKQEAEEEEEEEEEESNDENDNDNNVSEEEKNSLVNNASFILRSFAKQFNDINNSEKFDSVAHVYRHVCDVIELTNTESFEDLLLFTKKVYGEMQKDTDIKYQRIIRSLVVSRIYSGATSFKAREFIKSILNNVIKERDNTKTDIDNTNEELAEYLNALSCANCNSRLLVGSEPIAILECGHAIHYKPYCCAAANAGQPAPKDQIQKNICNIKIECPKCSKKEENTNDNSNK